MNTPRCSVLLCLIVVATSTAMPPGVPAAQAANAGQSYRALEKLPDFSGWWYLQLPDDQTPEIYFAGAQFLPAVLGQLAELAKTRNTSGLKAAQCEPPKFMGINGGFADDIEFLFTPGRITLLNESGLTRRIFMDASAADDADKTNAGTSIGRWEGRTLVVETHALNPKARMGPNWPGVPTIGRNAHVTERISLKDANTLEIVMRLDAPELLAQPFTVTFPYTRDVGHRFHEQVDCEDEDRAIDPASGTERFDLSPPADLPPPPVS